MPWTQESPLGAALGAASGYELGKQQRKDRTFQQNLEAQQAADQAALNAAQTQYYYSGSEERKAQTAKIYEQVSQMPHDDAVRTLDTYAKIGLINAQERNILEGQLPKEKAQTDYTKALTKKVYEGDIPLLKAKTTDIASMKYYRDQLLQEKYAALSAADQRTAQTLATRLQIAGADNDTKLAIATLATERMVYSTDVNANVRAAVADFQEGYKSYLQGQAQAGKGQGTGNLPATPPQPVSVNVSGGGGDQGAGAVLGMLLANPRLQALLAGTNPAGPQPSKPPVVPPKPVVAGGKPPVPPKPPVAVGGAVPPTPNGLNEAAWSAAYKAFAKLPFAKQREWLAKALMDPTSAPYANALMDYVQGAQPKTSVEQAQQQYAKTHPGYRPT